MKEEAEVNIKINVKPSIEINGTPALVDIFTRICIEEIERRKSLGLPILEEIGGDVYA